jgi:hypothetical protein
MSVPVNLNGYRRSFVDLWALGGGLFLPNNVQGMTVCPGLNVYEEFTHVSNFAGALTSAATVLVVRQNNRVYVDISGATGTTSASLLTLATALPARFRPTTDVFQTITAVDTAANRQGLLILPAATGVISIGLSQDTGTGTAITGVTVFTNAQTGGVRHISFNYNILA